MDECLITSISCWCGSELWCFDEQICALCKINKGNWQAECVVSPAEMLEGTDYVIKQMLTWGDKILLLPEWLHQRWVIYDKNTGKLEYENFCKESHRSVSSVLIGDQLIIMPICAKDPVVILDLRKKKIMAKQYLQDFCFSPDDGIEIWEVRANQGTHFFLLRGSCYYGQIKDQEIHLVKIQCPEPFLCADFCENNIWAVGNDGKYLYRFDKERNLLESFLLNLKTEIGRILAKDNYIFLIPLKGNRIWIFDKSSGEVKNIIMEEDNISVFPPLLGIADFWDYVKMGQEVWFLPIRYPLLVIDTFTGRSYQKRIIYTEDFSREKYWNYCNEVRKIRKRVSFFDEKVEGDVGKYLKLIQKDMDVSEERGFCGEMVWKVLRE